MNKQSKLSGFFFKPRQSSSGDQRKTRLSILTQPRRRLLPDVWYDIYVLGIPCSIILAAFIVSVVVSLTLPSAKGINAPTNEFSEKRALEYLNQISRTSRAMNQPENLRSQQYIYLAVQNITQKYKASFPDCNKKVDIEVLSKPAYWNGLEPALDGSVIPQYLGESNGIVVRVSNNQSSHSSSILFTANFDTVGLSQGVGDNALSVATLLEVISNILFEINLPLHSDLIFLFSNGDNAYSAGINSFFLTHSWSSTVSMFVALWGGGIGGKAQLFRYYHSNTLHLYASSSVRPWASELTSDTVVSGLLPQHRNINKELFRDNPGLIFAHSNHRSIAGSTNDKSKVIKDGSLQHLGDNIKALAVSSSNIQNLNEFLASWRDEGQNFIFFDVLGIFCVTVNKNSSIWFGSFVVFFAFIYVILRINASVSSRLNLQVGTVDIKILLTSFGMLVLMISVSFLPIIFLATIFSFVADQVATHYEMQIAIDSLWICAFVFIVHLLIQDKFPVAFRAGIERWSHHIHISCLLIWCLATIVTFPEDKGYIQIISIWTLVTLFQLLFDHSIRIIDDKNRRKANLSTFTTPSLTEPLLEKRKSKINPQKDLEEEGEEEEQEEQEEEEVPALIISKEEDDDEDEDDVGIFVEGDEDDSDLNSSSGKRSITVKMDEFTPPAYTSPRSGHISAKSFDTFTKKKNKKKNE